MTFMEHLRTETSEGERLIMLSPWTALRVLPDGSAMLYKNSVGYQSIPLSAYDLQALRNVSLPVRKFVPGPESEKDVHTEHCCILHGCKYGKEECPVMTQQKRQSQACEQCQWDGEGYAASMSPKPYSIAKIIETCSGCPSQWSARTTAGEYIYIRYRHGSLSVRLYRDEVEEPEDIYQENFTINGNDGCLDFYDLQAHTEGILDFANVKWVATEAEI